MHPVKAVIAARFPGAVVWHGEHTHRWWAMHPALPWLVEGRDPLDIVGQLDATLPHAGPLGPMVDDTLVDGAPPYLAPGDRSCEPRT